MLTTQDGQEAELALLDVRAVHGVIAHYADLELGIADAWIVVLAHRYGCHDILSLDERQFRAGLGWERAPFRLLPHDVA